MGEGVEVYIHYYVRSEGGAARREEKHFNIKEIVGVAGEGGVGRGGAGACVAAAHVAAGS